MTTIGRLMKAKFLALCLLIVTVGSVCALEIGPDQTHANLVSAIRILEDPKGKLGFEEIRSPSFSREFVAPSRPSGDVINLGFSQGAHWLKLTLSRQVATQSDWVLNIPFQSLDYLTLYAPGKTPVVTGNLAAFESRPIRSPYFAFPISLDTSPQDFYLRVSSQYATTIPIEISTPQAFNNAAQDTAFIQALYYGELLGLAIYNLLLFFYLRERSFLFYTLFAISLGLGIFAGNGYGRMYLWQDQPYWDEVAQSACLSLAAMFGILFTNSFLRVESLSPSLHKVLVALALVMGGLSLSMSLAHATEMPTTYLFMTFLVLAPVTTLLLISAGIMAQRAGRREARFFLLAWGILWTGAMIAALRAFGLVPTTTFTASATQISSAFEMLLLSFALADRIRLERQAREKAQLEKMAAEQSLKSEQKFREFYTRFGAYVSHEFRSPLNLIESQVALYQRERLRNIDNGEERLRNIGNATHHLADLFERWLQTDRLNHVLTKEASEKIDLNHWLPEFVSTAQQLYFSYELVLDTIKQPVTLYADTRLLKTALINLIDNACKYSEPSQIVRIGVIVEFERIGLFVADSGVGIAQENHEKIFDEYFRCDTTKRVHGIGLGLSFVKQIMLLHEGDMSLESTPGAGSIFFLWFSAQR